MRDQLVFLAQRGLVKRLWVILDILLAYSLRYSFRLKFVNDASGGELRVGHKQHACTQDVETSPVFQVDGRNVVLFDTPGFDDTHMSDTEVLQRIAGFLTTS